MRNQHSIDMTSGPVASKILLFSIPIILSGILQLLYNAADIAVVGRFAGKEALAAVGSTSSLINLFVNLFVGISAGVCVVLARSVGMGDKKSAEDITHTAIAFSFSAGIIFGALGFFLAPKILTLMNSPEDVIGKASLYLKIYFCGMPANLLYNFGSSLLRAVGDTRKPMIILIISGIVNVIFNLIFVIIFKMDVDGVGIATVISQILSAVMVICCLLKRDDECRLIVKKLKIHFKVLLTILKVGIPAGLQSCIFSISNIQIQSQINSFGSAAIAANSAAGNIEGFVYISMNAVYQAALSFTSQNYGASKPDRIKKVLFNCLGIVIAIGAIFSIIVIIFAPQLLSIYSKSAEIIEYGKIRIYIICTFYFICGIMEVLTGVMRGLNHSLAPMIVSVAGVCGIRMVWVWVIFPVFGTLENLYISYPVSWTITSFVHAICLFFVYKKTKELLK